MRYVACCLFTIITTSISEHFQHLIVDSLLPGGMESEEKQRELHGQGTCVKSLEAEMFKFIYLYG
jgi:hypothetical protein